MAMTAHPEVLPLTLSLKEQIAQPLPSHFLCAPLPLINPPPPTSLVSFLLSNRWQLVSGLAKESRWDLHSHFHRNVTCLPYQHSIQWDYTVQYNAAFVVTNLYKPTVLILHVEL